MVFLRVITAILTGTSTEKSFVRLQSKTKLTLFLTEVAKFINSDEDLSEWFKVHDHNHTIDCLLTHSEIKALSGDTKSLDGHRAYLGIVDEYHAHKTNQMYKLLEVVSRNSSRR